MAHDFNQYLNVPAAEVTPLVAEMVDAEWSRFGRNMHAMLFSERWVTAVNVCSMRGIDGTADVARRLRVFLTTGVIPS